MRFLHTSDWHLGKLFHEKSLIEDQEYVLNQIIEIIRKEEKSENPYAALVVSGDIYDRALPPAEATTLLNNFLVRVTEEFPSIHIFMNAGNHDSAVRLAYASEFLARYNIHIAADTKDICKPVILEHGKEKVAFYQLPFLTPLSIKSEDSEELLRTQQELYDAACKKISDFHAKNYSSIPSVINAHLFATGSVLSSSERTNVGTVEQVSVECFKDFTYGAFGHIHTFQPCDKQKRCYYSGSLLPYNFDDNPETGLLEVEIKNPADAPCVKRILFEPLHRIVKIKAELKDLIGSSADKNLVSENQNNYVQAILTDQVMPTEAFATLKTVFPYLLSVVMGERERKESATFIEQRKKAILSKDPEAIFDQFMKDVNGEPEKNELYQKQKELFIQESSVQPENSNGDN